MVPNVSIIMPAFNAEKFISKAIESVIQQTFLKWELIIIDDGSTDNTSEIVKFYQRADNRIHYYYQRNGRQSVARNLGTSKSSGKWIAFLDADDYWDHSKLKKQLEEAEKINADFIYTSGRIVDHNDNFISDYEVPHGEISAIDMYKKFYQYNPIPILSVLVKSQIIRSVGYWDEQDLINGRCEDLDYWIRIAKNNEIFYGIDEKLFSYRINPDGSSRNQLLMELGQVVVMLKNLDLNRFTFNEIRKIFSKRITLLFISLIRNNMLGEAYLLSEYALTLPLYLFKIEHYFLKKFKHKAVLPLRILNKLLTRTPAAT